MQTSDWHARFTQQVQWTAGARSYLFQRSGLEAGGRILEVGCGTGALLAALHTPTLVEPAQVGGKVQRWLSSIYTQEKSRAIPAGVFYGLDLSRDFLSLAARYIPHACLAQGDAHRLPYASGTFDATVCHFFLLWVADPQQALLEMKRVTRPGGWLLALAEPDYGGRIDYPDELARLGQLQEEALRRQGAKTRLGRSLKALFQATGLDEIETGILGGQWRSQPSMKEVSLEWAVLEADLDGQLPSDELARLRKLDEAAWQDGERTLFVPTFYAAGRKED